MILLSSDWQMGTPVAMPDEYTWRSSHQQSRSDPCNEACAQAGGHGHSWSSCEAYGAADNPYSSATAYIGLPLQGACGTQQSYQVAASFSPQATGSALLPPPGNPAHRFANPPVWPPRFPPPLAEAPPCKQYSSAPSMY